MRIKDVIYLVILSMKYVSNVGYQITNRIIYCNLFSIIFDNEILFYFVGHNFEPVNN